MQGQPTEPIIVKIIEPPESALTDLADVLLGSLGLTGVIVLLAVLLGLVLGGVLIGFRRLRDRNNPKAGPGEDAIHISPYA